MTQLFLPAAVAADQVGRVDRLFVGRPGCHAVRVLCHVDQFAARVQYAEILEDLQGAWLVLRLGDQRRPPGLSGGVPLPAQVVEDVRGAQSDPVRRQ